MSAAIDTSVLVAAIVATETHHRECGSLIDSGHVGIYSHGLAETFGTLTGGRKSFRLGPKMAAEIIEIDFIPFLSVTTLTAAESLRALRECDLRGVRGGAVFDFLHLAAARKAKASRFFTLDVSHFRAFHRPGDPEIAHP